MDTSKTGTIKSLLLQAWRERWTDIQWGINIKNVLPRGVSGDVYDLADCILQQALVGPGPNNLFLSYLTHCLSSQVVSYGAVLSSIGRYHSFYKPYCILSLLDLLKSIQPRITCYGNEEECIALSKAVVSVTHWLYACVLHSVTKLSELKQSPEHVSIMEKACDALTFFNGSNFVMALLYVGKLEDPSTYSQLLQKHQELGNKLTQVQCQNMSKEVIESVLGFIKQIDNLPCISANNTLSGPIYKQPLICSLNAMVAIDAVLSPASEIQSCVDQLLLLKKLQDLSLAELYCEIIRACFMGLIDASGSSEELKWAAFTFLKVPQLILKVHCTQNPAADMQEGCEGSKKLEEGLEQLLNYVPLLDLTDTKSNCECLQYLLNELRKVNLLSEIQTQKLLTRRQSESQRQKLPRPDQQTGQAGGSLILRAEPTVTSILKTLDSDYSKNQDALLGVLCHMIPGKSFELILSAAAATGKLHSFATKLIKFNEFNKQSTVESIKASQTRALLFDITFLMLCHIAQHYGTEVITGSAETKDSFFATWVSDCLAEGGRYKCPETMLNHCDQAKVDVLLSQFTNPESEFKTHLVKWHDVCMNASMAIKEVLLAWEHGAISTDNVKSILDYVKSRMCCLPVCISAWLCSYINILHYEMRLKPMNMLNHFMTPLSVDSGNTSDSGSTSTGSSMERQTPQQQQALDQNNPYYKERSTLMSSTIKKMMYDLHPPSQTKAKGISVISHGLTVKTPLWEIMEGIFTTVHSRGWLDLKTIHNLDTLLCVGGSQWFCDTLIRQMLKFEHQSELHRAVDLVFGLFQIDIEQCALALLVHILPAYLRNETRQDLLSEPRGSALARLTVLTTFSALQSRQSTIAQGPKRISRKRPHRDLELEEMCDGIDRLRPSKMRRGVNDAEMLDDTPIVLQSGNDEHFRATMSEPINKAISDIMRMLMVIATDPTISQRSLFPVLFLEQLVLCAKKQAHTVLQFMPLNMVPQLIKSIPEAFTHEFVLAVCNMETTRARKVAARTLCQLNIAHQRAKC